jgi:hypothetical protein
MNDSLGGLGSRGVDCGIKIQYFLRHNKSRVSCLHYVYNSVCLPPPWVLGYGTVPGSAPSNLFVFAGLHIRLGVTVSSFHLKYAFNRKHILTSQRYKRDMSLIEQGGLGAAL